MAQAFVMLFVVLDPIGNVPIFLTLTSGLTGRLQRRVASESVVVAASTLIFFAFIGWPLLNVLRVTLSDFKIACGIVLFIIAIEDMLLERKLFEGLERKRVAVVPLGIPLLAGPGSIATVMVLMREPFGPHIMFFAVLVNMVLAWIILVSGRFLAKFLGKEGMRVVTKILGLILVAFAIMLIREGIIAWAPRSPYDGF